MKYRKKPVVIDATQWLGWELGPHDLGLRKHPTVPSLAVVDSLEGPASVVPGDFVVTGVRGERYPVQQHVFAETYEAAE